MDIGLSLAWVRFRHPGRFSLALKAGGLAFVSEQAEASTTPTWNFDGIRLKLASAEAFEIELLFYDAAEFANDRRSLLQHGKAICCSKLRLLQADCNEIAAGLNQERCVPLYERNVKSNSWEETGAVLANLGLPMASYIDLVPSHKLPSAPAQVLSLPPEEKLIRLKAMGKTQENSLRALATRLESMQKALSSLETHQQKLASERDDLISESGVCKKQLAQIKEPHMTDLDIELMLSLPAGFRGFSAVMLATEERWKRARDEVIGQWAKYQELRKEVEIVRNLQQKLQSFEPLRLEQQRALGEATRRAQEAGQVRDAAARQASLIAVLERKTREAKDAGGPKAELQLLCLQEQGARDVLREKEEQIALQLGKHFVLDPGNSQKRGARDGVMDLAREVEKKTQEVQALLSKCEQIRIAKKPVLKPAAELKRGDSQRRAMEEDMSEAEKAVQQAQLLGEDLQRRCDLEEVDIKKQAQKYGIELAKLKSELADKSSRVSQLEAKLGVGTS